MDDTIKNLKGSDSRDEFRLHHKLKCPKRYYGQDIDFCLVSFKLKDIIAILDFKMTGLDSITQTEIVVYNELMKRYPVYVIESFLPPEKGSFTIYRYKQDGALEIVRETKDWDEYSEWEQQVRDTAELYDY